MIALPDARRGGLLAGWTRQPIACPFGVDELDLRLAWLSGYTEGRSLPAVTVDELAATLDRVAEYRDRLRPAE